MRPNTTKQTLKAGGTVVGTQVQQLRSPESGRLLGVAGADFVWVDGEHGPFGQETTHDLVRAIAMGGATPIVRVADYSYALVARALDSGAQGVILPRAMNVEGVREALSWTRFPPAGVRGYGLGAPHLEYEKVTFAHVIAHANEHTLNIVQFEHPWAIDHASELLALPDIDVVLVGPADLSIALGVPGEFTHPTLIAAVERVIAACRTAGVAPGIHLRSAALATDWIARGMRFVSVGAEHVFMLERATEAMQALKSAAAAQPAGR